MDSSPRFLDETAPAIPLRDVEINRVATSEIRLGDGYQDVCLEALSALSNALDRRRVRQGGDPR